MNENGYPIYRRRQSGDKGGFHAKLGSDNREFIVDNRWVVPYNPYLLLRFNAHINVEICSTVQSVKYLYKYILKGNDTASFEIVTVDGEDEAEFRYDEIRQFIHSRYVTPPEG